MTTGLSGSHTGSIMSYCNEDFGYFSANYTQYCKQHLHEPYLYHVTWNCILVLSVMIPLLLRRKVYSDNYRYNLCYSAASILLD